MAHYICGNIKIPDPGDEDFIDYMLKVGAEESPHTCPFCGNWYDPNYAEYEYRDFGYYEQIAPNHCENEECNAYELGYWKMSDKQVYLHGWVRDRQPEDGDKYPTPSHVGTEVEEPLNAVESFIDSMDTDLEKKAVMKELLKELYIEAK